MSFVSIRNYLTLSLTLFSLSAFGYDLQALTRNRTFGPVTTTYKYNVDPECALFHIQIPTTDPIDGGAWNIEIDYYRPQGQTNLPSVIFLPTILGFLPPDHVMAWRLCHERNAVFLSKVTKDIPAQEVIQSLAMSDDSLKRAIAGVATVIDYLQSVYELDHKNFAAFGMSQGGIFAAMVAGVETRLKATVIVVGGGNLPHVFAHSTVQGVTAQRNARMKFFNLKDDDEYEALLRKNTELDPLDVAPNVNPNSVLMFIAQNDTMVPTVDQIALWQALGRPQSVTIPLVGHVGALIDLPVFEEQRVSHFIAQKFAE